jgi:hypothetical protein
MLIKLITLSFLLIKMCLQFLNVHEKLNKKTTQFTIGNNILLMIL